MNGTFIMKAQELRIGNCFMAGKNPAVVLEIMASGVSFDSINGDICASHCDWDYVSFIPLTEQWLIYFGFKDYGSRGFVSKEAFSPGHPSQRFDIDWSKKTGTMCKSRYQEDNDCFTMRHIKHVHQLQNLYFALTGEDLHL